MRRVYPVRSAKTCVRIAARIGGFCARACDYLSPGTTTDADRTGGRLVGCDEADAEHRPTARTGEGRERRLALPEGWNELQSIGIRHAPPALGAAECAKTQLGVCRLQVREADSLFPPHLAPPPSRPADDGPSCSCRQGPEPAGCST